MITEDYCSQELFNLLRDKGFNGEYQVPNSHSNKLLITHQMAMKWLREVHRKYIDIRYNNQNEEYRFIVFTMVKDKPIDFIHSEYHSTYEKAVEAALKYCLTNLINNETN